MAEHQLTCRGCGKQFTFHRRKAYCQPACRASLAHVGRDPHVNAACRQEHECYVCGAVFKPKRAGRTTTCGRKCGLVWASFKTGAVHNGQRVSVRTKIRRKRDKPPKVYYEPVLMASCRCCGAEFNRTKEGTTRFMCSPECVEMASAKARRTGRKKRRALERGARRAERVDPIAVFERDGWRCQFCGVKTPRRLRGSCDARAPELDHIMPVSKGGEHTYRNTQCLCRSCNGAKGNAPKGQLALL